jgi:hypothetical protein
MNMGVPPHSVRWLRTRGVQVGTAAKAWQRVDQVAIIVTPLGCFHVWDHEMACQETLDASHFYVLH